MITCQEKIESWTIGLTGAIVNAQLKLTLLKDGVFTESNWLLLGK